MRLRRLLAAGPGRLPPSLLAGCGNKVEVRTVAETEGIYVDVGELKYQVQLSRILNPNDVEDKAYLQGLPAGTEPLEADEAWFGVWIRVENTTDEMTLTSAEEFEIVDTQEHTFEPIALAETNPFAYAPQDADAADRGAQLRLAAGEGVIQGSLILFKVTTEALANRPLEFKIQSPALPDDVGIVDLDVCSASAPPRSPSWPPGAAVSPPAPWPTSSTATATRGWR